MSAIRWLIAQAILAPLIRINYRARSDGDLPDEWYWADNLALKWGYALDENGRMEAVF